MIDTMSFALGMLFNVVVYLILDAVYEWSAKRGERKAREELNRKRVGFGE